MQKIFDWMRSAGSVTQKSARNSVDSDHFDAFFDASKSVVAEKNNACHKRAKTLRVGEAALKDSKCKHTPTMVGETSTSRIMPPNPFECNASSSLSLTPAAVPSTDEIHPLYSTSANSSLRSSANRLEINNESSRPLSRSGSFRGTFRGLKRRLTPRKKFNAVPSVDAATALGDAINRVETSERFDESMIASSSNSSPRPSKLLPKPLVAIYVNEHQHKGEPVIINQLNSTASAVPSRQSPLLLPKVCERKIASAPESRSGSRSRPSTRSESNNDGSAKAKIAISIEDIIKKDERNLEQLSVSNTTGLRKLPEEASTLRGSTPTPHIDENPVELMPNESQKPNQKKVSIKKTQMASSVSKDVLRGRRITLASSAAPNRQMLPRRSSITAESAVPPFEGMPTVEKTRSVTSSVDALLQSAGADVDEYLATLKTKEEIRLINAPIYNANSSLLPITLATCKLTENSQQEFEKFIKDNDPVEMKPKEADQSENYFEENATSRKQSVERLPIDAARCALVAATATALPAAATNELCTAAHELIDDTKATVTLSGISVADDQPTISSDTPPASTKAERRRLRFLVPQISVSSVDSVPHAIAKANVTSLSVMTQSASGVENPFLSSISMEYSKSTSPLELSCDIAQRRATSGDVLRRRASLAARRQSNVQLVQKAVGRRTSTTLVPLTPAQIHLVRALWRQVFLTKGPTVIGQTLIHRLFFKTPKLKELFRVCPVPPDQSNHDHFAKHHCKAVGDMIDQIVENLDDLETVELGLETIGRSHARLINGALSSKIWDSVAETFIDCTLEWGDRRSRSETVRKAWALIVAFTVEKIKHGHLDERKQMMILRSNISSLENVALSTHGAPPASPI